jgi:sec-independent protein translocase protein TatA
MLADILGTDGIIVIVVVAVVLLVGGSRIPKIARSLGSAKNEFEKGSKEGDGTSKATDVAAPAKDVVPPTS